MKSKSTKYPVSLKVRTDAGIMVNIHPDGDLAIDVSRLSEEMAQQPGKYAYYASLAEMSYRKAKLTKFKIHSLREDLDTKLRGEKKVTETQLKNKINAHPKMRKLYAKYVRYQEQGALLRVLREAFAQRKDMLQSIGANSRDRNFNDVHTLQKAAHRRMK